MLTCSSGTCTEPAVEALALRGQPGHVHDCARHAAQLREWCDVTASSPIVDGHCPAIRCTGNHYIGVGMPTPLDPKENP